jgi:hypothetical protein
MKRILLILFSVLYLFTVSGVALNLHYCGEELRTVSVVLKPAQKGCCGSKKMMKGKCCKNSIHYVKVSSDQQNVHSAKVPVNCLKKVVLFAPLLIDEQAYVSLETKKYTDYHSPPIIPKDLLYIENRVLLI